MTCQTAFKPSENYLSTVVFNGNGSTTSFSYTFDYLNRDVWSINSPNTASTSYNPYLKIYVNGVAQSYTMSDASTLVLASAPPAGTANVVIRRDSSISARAVDYVEGSVLTETNLDRDSKQAFFLAQEIYDRTLDLQCRTDNRYVNAYHFTANGSQSVFTLNTSSSSTGLGSETRDLNREEVLVYLNGTAQQARSNVYSVGLSGGFVDVALASPPANGTLVEIRTVVSGASQAMNITAGSIDTTKLANGAVTFVKTNFDGASGNNTFLVQRSGAAKWDSITAGDISNFDGAVTAKRLDQFAAPTTTVGMGNQRIINLGAPSATGDAVTKKYVDDLVTNNYIPQVAYYAQVTPSTTTTDATISVPFAWQWVRISGYGASNIHNIRAHSIISFANLSNDANARTDLIFMAESGNRSIFAYRSGNSFIYRPATSGATNKNVFFEFVKNAAGI
jgi:hypothetical protein